MGGSRNAFPSWISAAASRFGFDKNVSSTSEAMFTEESKASPLQHQLSNNPSDVNLGFGERAISAAGAAFLSAILVNPLDVAKVSLALFSLKLNVLFSFMRFLKVPICYFDPPYLALCDF